MNLIDVDELKKKEVYIPCGTGKGLLFHGVTAATIDAMPIVQAKPIGRCKDCEHYTLLRHCKIHSQEPDEYGPGAYVEMNPDDFCSYFEPKGENNNEV